MRGREEGIPRPSCSSSDDSDTELAEGSNSKKAPAQHMPRGAAASAIYKLEHPAAVLAAGIKDAIDSEPTGPRSDRVAARLHPSHAVAC